MSLTRLIVIMALAATIMPGTAQHAIAQTQTSPIAQPGEERSLEASLRPQRLSDDEYINQDKVKGQLRIVIEAAKARNEPLEHVAPAHFAEAEK